MTYGQFLMPFQLGIEIVFLIEKIHMSFAKWIGAGIGWTFGGPIGAILGMATGSLFDGVSVTKDSQKTSNDKRKQ